MSYYGGVRDEKEKKKKSRENCDPEHHQEEAEQLRGEKRKEISVGNKAKQWKDSLK